MFNVRLFVTEEPQLEDLPEDAHNENVEQDHDEFYIHPEQEKEYA